MKSALPGTSHGAPGTCSSTPSVAEGRFRATSSVGSREPSQRERFTSCTSCSRTRRTSSFHLGTPTGQSRSMGSTRRPGRTTRGSCFRATSDTCSRSRTQTSWSGDLSAVSRGGPLRPRASRGRRGSRCELPSGRSSTAVTEANFGDIANVPLFVKYPNQDGRNRRTRALPARWTSFRPLPTSWVSACRGEWTGRRSCRAAGSTRVRRSAVVDDMTLRAGVDVVTDRCKRRWRARRLSSEGVATRSIESA